MDKINNNLPKSLFINLQYFIEYHTLKMKIFAIDFSSIKHHFTNFFFFFKDVL